MAKRVRACINPDTLAWARETAGYTVDEIASSQHRSVADIRAWESGQRPIYLGQLRDLAKRYKRPISDFYLAARPDEPPIPHDFRRLPGEVAGVYSPPLRQELRLRQALAIDLSETLGDDAPAFTSQVSIDDDPEVIGQHVRDTLGITRQVQASWKDSYAALREWRQRIEAEGVLVFEFEGIDSREVLGFSIGAPALPVIAVNVGLHPHGQMFTLLHQFAHLLLGAAGICDIDDYSHRGEAERGIEVFCNHVAAAALMPSDAFLAHDVVTSAAGTSRDDWDDDAIKALASAFRVSREATVRRLLTFGLTSQSFYRARREQYLAEFRQQRERGAAERKERGQAGGRNPAARSLANLGQHFVSLVLQGYGDRRLTLADTAVHLGVRAGKVRELQDLSFGRGTGG